MSEPTYKVDARGMGCPGPITEVIKVYRKAKNGDVIEVLATDMGFKKDIEAWTRRTKNELVTLEETDDRVIHAVIKVTGKA